MRNRYDSDILGQLIPEGGLDDRVGFVVWSPMLVSVPWNRLDITDGGGCFI
jgi:hypothetical protein